MKGESVCACYKNLRNIRDVCVCIEKYFDNLTFNLK